MSMIFVVLFNIKKYKILLTFYYISAIYKYNNISIYRLGKSLRFWYFIKKQYKFKVIIF
jgi:hypothetical protein